MGLYGILVVTTPVNGATPGLAYPTVAGLPVTSLAVSQYDRGSAARVERNRSGAERLGCATAVATCRVLRDGGVGAGLPGGCGRPRVRELQHLLPAGRELQPALLPRQRRVLRPNQDCVFHGANSHGARHREHGQRHSATRQRVACAWLFPRSSTSQDDVDSAEDGNPLPGQPRIQNEVFMAAGKTYDVEVKPTQAAGAYSAATLALFDRQLSLSTNNQRDGGMQAYIGVAGGAATGAGSAAGSGVTLAGVTAKTFYCVSGTTLSVSDPLSGLLGGSTGANGVAVTATSLPGTLTVQSSGTFTYVPPASGACGGTFTYLVNNSQSVTSTIAECDASTNSAAAGCQLGGAPTLANDSFTGSNAKLLTINPPGVLLNAHRSRAAGRSRRGSRHHPDQRIDEPHRQSRRFVQRRGTRRGHIHLLTYNVKNSQQIACAAAPATAHTQSSPRVPACRSGWSISCIKSDTAWDIADASKKGATTGGSSKRIAPSGSIPSARSTARRGRRHS